MLIIVILSLLPIDTIEAKIKHKFDALALLKLNIENSLKIHIDLSLIQSTLHFPFYALLAFLWMGFFNEVRIELRKAAFSAIGITFFFSLCLEFLQFFLVERNASLIDLLLNLSGSLSGVYIYRLMRRKAYALGNGLA
jgi:glycopeptide antibiotics resistance protein